ncbi:hypothetical protein BC832DRAFT_556771 [Gaertneriomyces semiglobifer]|nr:hypothetical protein BC832DRAFT_556771 [Gaertneriomyces semiglobifer]
MTTTADNILGATPPHSQHSRFLLHPTGNHATAKPSFRGVFSKPLPEWLTLPRPIPRLTSGDIILSRDAVHRESTAASDPLLGRLTPKALHDVFEAQVRYLLERFRELSRSWGKTDDDTSRSRDMAEPLAIKSKVQSTNARMRVLKSQLKDTWESFRSLLDWEPFLSRVVSTGEELVGLHGMFNVAREVCFSEFLAQVDNGTVPAEDIVDSSNALLSLRYRTRYGLAMCDYLQCIYLDPSMDDSTTIEGSLTSLDDMLELMESCAAEEATAGLAYWGSVMIRKLVDRMSKCNKWSEVCLAGAPMF